MDIDRAWFVCCCNIIVQRKGIFQLILFKHITSNKEK